MLAVVVSGMVSSEARPGYSFSGLFSVRPDSVYVSVCTYSSPGLVYIRDDMMLMTTIHIRPVYVHAHMVGTMVLYSKKVNPLPTHVSERRHFSTRP